MIEQVFGALMILFATIASGHYYLKKNELLAAASLALITSLIILPAVFFFLNVLIKIPLNAVNAGITYLLASCLFIYLVKTKKH